MSTCITSEVFRFDCICPEQLDHSSSHLHKEPEDDSFFLFLLNNNFVNYDPMMLVRAQKVGARCVLALKLVMGSTDFNHPDLDSTF